jgi:hypothetical protein
MERTCLEELRMPFLKYAKIMHYEEESHCLKSEPLQVPVKKKKIRIPARADRLKIFTLIRNNSVSV